MLSWMQKFVKILLKFDKKLTKILPRAKNYQKACGMGDPNAVVLHVHVEALYVLDVNVPVMGHDTSLFPRLVLGWINADFRVQLRICQHLSRSTRKSSSREQICKILQTFTEFCKILRIFWKFSENLNAKFWKILETVCRIFCRVL